MKLSFQTVFVLTAAVTSFCLLESFQVKQSDLTQRVNNINKTKIKINNNNNILMNSEHVFILTVTPHQPHTDETLTSDEDTLVPPLYAAAVAR